MHEHYPQELQFSQRRVRQLEQETQQLRQSHQSQQQVISLFLLTYRHVYG